MKLSKIRYDDLYGDTHAVAIDREAISMLECLVREKEVCLVIYFNNGKRDLVLEAERDKCGDVLIAAYNGLVEALADDE